MLLCQKGGEYLVCVDFQQDYVYWKKSDGHCYFERDTVLAVLICVRQISTTERTCIGRVPP